MDSTITVTAKKITGRTYPAGEGLRGIAVTVFVALATIDGTEYELRGQSFDTPEEAIAFGSQWAAER